MIATWKPLRALAGEAGVGIRWPSRVIVSSEATIWRKGAGMIGIRWLAALPFVGIIFGTAFVNRVEPLVFGMPLVLAWIVGWVVASSVIMAAIYVLDPINKRAGPGGEGAER